MIINGKYFLPPPKDAGDFNELFGQLIAAGAGRPVDKDGFSSGPWTPELLADAISNIAVNHRGVDIRTVQLWFQENAGGIRSDNIRWMARIFGCNDPKATSEWQVKLFEAHRQLISERKKKTKPKRTSISPPSGLVQVSHTPSQAEAIQETITTAQKPRFKLATNSEALFCDQSLLNLPALVWAGFVFIGFLAYIMGVHSITYSPIEGLNKQVGFFWAPNWTLLEMIILPLFLITVAGTLNYWKRERHSMTAFFSSSLLNDDDGWARKVEAFSLSHWALIFICFFVVFILQWYGLHMRALMDANSSELMMDWNLIAIVRPEIISVPEATLLSMLAFLYTASICFLFLTGLVLLFTLAADFYDIHASNKKYENKDQQFKVQSVGLKILCGIFRCTILGILIGTCIKLQGTFLLSDGETIVTWLVDDALYAIGSTEEKGGWLAQRSLAHFTSFLLVFSTCSVFIYGFVQIYRILYLASLTDTARTWGDYQIVLWSMMSVVFLLVANFLLIGQIPGFSIFLTVSILIATYCLYV